MHTHALVQIPELCCGFSFSLPSFHVAIVKIAHSCVLYDTVCVLVAEELLGMYMYKQVGLLITEVFLSHHLLRVMLRPNELVWVALPSIVA